MTQIKVTILPSGKAGEVNPLGEKPKLEDYPQSLSAEAAWEDDLVNWYEAEENLREFDIELDECICNKVGQEAECKRICIPEQLEVGSIHTADIIGNKVRIIK